MPLHDQSMAVPLRAPLHVHTQRLSSSMSMMNDTPPLWRPLGTATSILPGIGAFQRLRLDSPFKSLFFSLLSLRTFDVDTTNQARTCRPRPSAPTEPDAVSITYTRACLFSLSSHKLPNILLENFTCCSLHVSMFVNSTAKR